MSLSQSSYLFGQQALVTMKTPDHGRQEIFRDYFIEVERMPGGHCHKPYECKLASAISITKGMNGVERGQEGRRPARKLMSR